MDEADKKIVNDMLIDLEIEKSLVDYLFMTMIKHDWITESTAHNLKMDPSGAEDNFTRTYRERRDARLDYLADLLRRAAIRSG